MKPKYIFLFLIFLLPCVASATLSGYDQSVDFTIQSNGLACITANPFGTYQNNCETQGFFGAYPDDSMNVGGGSGNCGEYQLPVCGNGNFAFWETTHGAGDYYMAIRRTDDSVKKYYVVHCSGDCNNHSGTGWSVVPMGSSLSITSPATETQITDDSTLIWFSYSGFTTTNYPDAYSDFGISIWFDIPNAQSSSAFHYTTIDSSGSGTFSVPISAFGMFVYPSSFWYAHARPYYTDDIGNFVEDTELDMSSYALSYMAISASNSTYCATIETQTDCNNSFCLWDTGTSICSALSSPPEASSYGFETEDFGLLGNMFRDVIVFLFFPSQDNINFQFSNLKSSISQRLPFAYISALQTAWTTGQTELSSGDYPKIEIDDPFDSGSAKMTILDLSATRDFMGSTSFDLFRTIMGYLFWLGAFYFLWETLHKSNSTKL